METRPTPGSQPPLEIQAPAPLQWGALVCCLMALTLPALSFVAPKYAKIRAFLSAGPAAVAIALVLTRRGPFAAVCDETGIQLTQPSELVVPCDTIQGIIPIGRKPLSLHKPAQANYTIRVVHAGGMFDIPRTIGLESDRVLHFLLGHIPASGSRELPRPLAEHLQQCLDQVSAEQVLSYRGRREVWLPWSVRKRLLALGLALAAVAAAWIGSFEGALPVLGFVAATTSVNLLLLTPPFGIYPSGLRKAALVLSPQGLAIRQPGYFGYADWHEITAIRWGRPKSDIIPSIRRAINLTLEEQELPIYDVYDRPGLIIYSRMLKYWHDACGRQGQAPSPAPETGG